MTLWFTTELIFFGCGPRWIPERMLLPNTKTLKWIHDGCGWGQNQSCDLALLAQEDLCRTNSKKIRTVHGLERLAVFVSRITPTTNTRPGCARTHTQTHPPPLAPNTQEKPGTEEHRPSKRIWLGSTRCDGSLKDQSQSKEESAG